MEADLSYDVRVLPDPDALGREAASIFVESARAAISSAGRFSVAVSGGSTPRTLYCLLRSGEYKDMVDWGRTHFFWADERCVPPGHPDSNYGAAYRLMLSGLPVPPGNIHRIKGELPPEAAARGYEGEIEAYFKGPGHAAFDLVLLGVGEDGHTASLFPGSRAVMEETRLAVPVYAGRRRGWRVTLTLPTINGSSRVVFLASGPSKAPVIAGLLGRGGGGKNYPAVLVRPVSGRLTWLVDNDAAACLTG